MGTMIHGWMESLIQWYMASLDQWGYLMVGLLMAMESSIIPVPSEFVVPPAAWQAHDTGRLSIVGIVIASTVGSWIGATAMYWGARWIGRPLLLKYGKYVLISHHKIHGAENWMAHYGGFGVFVARLLPVIRHLVGIPAGLAKMNFGTYSLYTVIGSAIWSAVLCWIGIKVGNNMEMLKKDMKLVTLGCVAFVAVMGAVYYLMVHRHMNKTPATPRE